MWARTSHLVALLSVTAVFPALAQQAQPQEESAEDKARRFAEIIEWGMERYRKGDYLNAIHLFRKAQGVQPAPNLWFNIARSYHKLGQADPAIENYEQFINHPDTASETKLKALGYASELKSELLASTRAKLNKPAVPETRLELTVHPKLDQGTPPWLALGTIAATLALGGVTTWSALDTRSAKNDYEAAPTAAAFADGRSKQTRTNVLIFTTAGLALVSTIFTVLTTDWGGDG